MSFYFNLKTWSRPTFWLWCWPYCSVWLIRDRVYFCLELEFFPLNVILLFKSKQINHIKIPYLLSDFLSLTLTFPIYNYFFYNLSSYLISYFLWFNNFFKYIFSNVSLLWIKSINSLYLNFIIFSYYFISFYLSFLNAIIR